MSSPPPDQERDALLDLLQRSPLLPDPLLRQSWQTVLPFLPAALRFDLLVALQTAERQVDALASQEPAPPH